MSISSRLNPSARQTASQRQGPPSSSVKDGDSQLKRWGGLAGVAGALFLIASAVVTIALDLPDASDVETLTDFADIESGRIAEHFLYLGALVFFALHVSVLNRLLRMAHPVASLFGTVVAGFGLVIMAASSVLHVSTSALFDLYDSPDTPPEDLPAIEYAWHGAQSVFDTMLATGVLLVPIGIVLFGLAMGKTAAFGRTLAMTSIVLGAVGIVGAVIAIIDPGSAFSAISVLAIVVFHLYAGWKTLAMANHETIDVTEREATPVD